eukprot:5694-Chlamydomonas_euryale.AAC.1
MRRMRSISGRPRGCVASDATCGDATAGGVQAGWGGGEGWGRWGGCTPAGVEPRGCVASEGKGGSVGGKERERWRCG